MGLWSEPTQIFLHVLCLLPRDGCSRHVTHIYEGLCEALKSLANLYVIGSCFLSSVFLAKDALRL